MTLYAIHATVVLNDKKGWAKMVQIPSFILNSNCQGIVSVEHAEQIATDIINPARDPQIVVSVTAFPWRDFE